MIYFIILSVLITIACFYSVGKAAGYEADGAVIGAIFGIVVTIALIITSVSVYTAAISKYAALEAWSEKSAAASRATIEAARTDALVVGKPVAEIAGGNSEALKVLDQLGAIDLANMSQSTRITALMGNHRDNIFWFNRNLKFYQKWHDNWLIGFAIPKVPKGLKLMDY